MNRWAKLGIVLVGYVMAVVVSIVTVAIYDRHFTAQDNQTMGGMIAGGEMMLGAGVFFLASLVPTGLAIWFLRRSRAVWSAFSVAGLAFAIIGLAAVITSFTIREAPGAPLLALVALLGIAQMMGSPIWAGGFALFALLAPARHLRQRMLVALAIEVVIGACGLVHFLVPMLPI